MITLLLWARYLLLALLAGLAASLIWIERSQRAK
jgi:hypothetical protein